MYKWLKSRSGRRGGEEGWGGRWGGGERAELISSDRVVDLELRPLWARHWPSWGLEESNFIVPSFFFFFFK